MKPSKKKSFFFTGFPIPSKKLVNLVNCYLVKKKTFFEKLFFTRFNYRPVKSPLTIHHQRGKMGGFCAPVHRGQNNFQVPLVPKLVVPHCSLLMWAGGPEGGGGVNPLKCCSNCGVHNIAANHLSMSDCPAAGLNKQRRGSSNHLPHRGGGGGGSRLDTSSRPRDQASQAVQRRQ